MFCKYCGNQLPDDVNFCPKCGTINDIAEGKADHAVRVEPSYSEPAVDVIDEQKAKEKKELGGSIMKFAIMGIAFALSFYLSPLGLVFSIISKVKLGIYKNRYGETEGAASVGKGIGIASLILSIVFTALLILTIVLSVIEGFYFYY